MIKADEIIKKYKICRATLCNWINAGYIKPVYQKENITGRVKLYINEEEFKKIYNLKKGIKNEKTTESKKTN